MLINGSSASGARPKNIRYNNCRAVLDLFSHSNKLSVHEITERFNLSKTATMNIINLLISTGIIYLYGKGDSIGTTGKKPSLYALNPAYKYSIVVGFDGDYTIAELLDFRLNKVNFYLQKAYDGSYKAVVDSAALAITRLMERAGLNSDALYAVAVYTGGIVDAKSGILLRPIPFNNWDNDLPLTEDLKKALPFDVPIYLDNICRFGGYYELLKNPGNRNRTILSLFINEEGVGGSLIQNGVIARGKYGLIGEFGHITTNYTLAEKCKCGRYGCFETVVTGTKVVERARKALREKVENSDKADTTDKTLTNSTLTNSTLTNSTLKRLNDIFTKADVGDPFAQSQLDFVVDQFANMLYNMQIMYDPDTVIIQGIYADSGTYFKKKLTMAVDELSLYSIAKSLRLVFDEYDFREAVTLGASFYCREQYLNGDPLFDIPDPDIKPASFRRPV